MPKPNTYVQLLAARRQIAELCDSVEVMKGFTMQQCLDMAQIALNREFQFGPKYEARFEKAFRSTFVEYAQLCVDDGREDPEIDYTKGKIDRALETCCGDAFRPWEERYAVEHLYFRDRDLKEET